MNYAALRHLLRPLHCCRVCFHLLRLVTPRQTVTLTQEEAEAILEQLHPDGGHSCLRPAGSDVSAPDAVGSQGQAPIDLRIIVPVYNCAAYVGACLDSLAGQQTRYTFRVSVVDDGSTDGSERLVERYQSDPRFCIIHQPNRGVSAARNRALQQLDARFVLFVDADDELPPRAVELLLDKAYALDADIVEGNMQHGTTALLRPLHAPQDITGYAGGKLIRSTLFQKILFPEGYRYEDTIVAFLLRPMARRVATLPDVTYIYRQHADSFTAAERRNPATLDAYWVVRRLLIDIATCGLPLDDTSYSQVLQAMKLSADRTSSLGTTAGQAYFAAMCGLVATYFPQAQPDAALAYIHRAVRQRDYRLYLMASQLL